jgi:opacity protein-like surface antigen
MAIAGTPSCAMRLRLLLLAATIGISLAPLLQAEDSPNDASGFRVRPPHVFAGMHLGLNVPRANSDLFALITKELTLAKSDFRSPSFGFDFGVPFQSHFAAVFSFDYARSSPQSESRDFTEANGDPITQTTRFSQIPITVSLRYYPIKMGETLGSYAWVPARILPYVGGGIGFLHYNFNQTGSFVDRETLIIFDANLHSQGVVWTDHAFAGADVSISPLIFVNGEIRYSWADAGLSSDFKGFKPIDLSGFRLQGGIYFRF